MGRRRHFGDDSVDLLNEAVEPASQLTDLVVARDLESPGQVAFALGNRADYRADFDINALVGGDFAQGAGRRGRDFDGYLIGLDL